MSLLDIIAQDSGNRNVPNAQGSGATGYFQITGTNWRNIGQNIFGFTAPNAMSASAAQQATVAQYLNNQSGGLANWGKGGTFFPHMSFADTTPNSSISNQDVADFAASHGDTTPVFNVFESGSSGNDTATHFVSVPNDSGFGTGLTAGDQGASSSDQAGVGNVLPGGSAAVDLSLSPDLQRLTDSGTTMSDFGGLSTPQSLGQTKIGSDVFSGQNGPLGAGSSPLAATAAPSKLIPNFVEDVLGYFQRGAIIILGIVLIAIAAYALTRDGGVLPRAGILPRRRTA